MEDNNNLILKQAFKLFQLDISEVNINKIGNSANLIYDLQNEHNAYILRISKKTSYNLSRYEAEMDYVNYLFSMKVNVSRIILSINNKFVEVIYDNDECYFISVFEKANGHPPRVDNADEWNERLFYQWGKTMGKIHCLVKDYTPKEGIVAREQWNEDINFEEGYRVTKEDFAIYNIWTEIINEMSTFPKDKNSYGLIHNDFHQCNFFIHDDSIVVFDFDDCLYHWYACDIAIALYHSLQTIPIVNAQERTEFGVKFIENFLKGYLEENKVEEEWIERIPLFLEYRRICSYNFILKLWTNNELNDSRKEYLKNIRYNIENRLPYIDIDFKRLKKFE
ncbi:phosphotransferase enzyme family protein [Clostridium sp. UBA6640]|uniref:phosphotransferase enzyme family protein n=1 Tax=Clostridium sp. UBA6640 TaxID=1946370 RepID=UPI0025C32ED3|nr:phosphotransferase [Clostridium sp. UBA6640]